LILKETVTNTNQNSANALAVGILTMALLRHLNRPQTFAAWLKQEFISSSLSYSGSNRAPHSKNLVPYEQVCGWRYSDYKYKFRTGYVVDYTTLTSNAKL